MEKILEKNKLFVGNLDRRVKRFDLKEYFAQYGEVLYTKVVYDRETRRSRWFGFVVFADEAITQKAMEEAQWKEFMGRELYMEYAQAKEEDENDPHAGEQAADDAGTEAFTPTESADEGEEMAMAA